MWQPVLSRKKNDTSEYGQLPRNSKTLLMAGISSKMSGRNVSIASSTEARRMHLAMPMNFRMIARKNKPCAAMNLINAAFEAS